MNYILLQINLDGLFLYKDVKEEIQTLNNNEFTVLIPQIEEKRNRIEELVI